MSKYKMMKLRIITKVCIVFRECQKNIEEKALPYVYIRTYRVYFVFTTYRNSNGNNRKGSPLCNLI